MKKRIARQGDVIFEALSPEAHADLVKRYKEGDEDVKVLGKLIRRGENGGCHAIAPESEAVQVEVDGRRYVLSLEGVETPIVHREHNTVPLAEPGYEIRIQREMRGDRQYRVID